MVICVCGLGYVGLPQAMLLHESGFEVIGYDKKHIKMRDGSPLPFKLYNNFFPDADVYIVCVPTPFRKVNKQTSAQDVFIKDADLSAVWDVIIEIKHSFVGVDESSGINDSNINSNTGSSQKNNKKTILIESTVPVNTIRTIKEYLGKNALVAYCPERVFPGKTEKDEMIYNCRVIGVSEESGEEEFEAAKNIYGEFLKGEIIKATYEEAEAAKLIENTYRDVNIAFACEVGEYCQQTGIDFWRLQNIVNKHPRVNLLSVGAGVGGHCIAVDPYFLTAPYNDETGEQYIFPTAVCARNRNELQPYIHLDRIEAIMTAHEIDRVAIMGISYKPDIDDCRESPAKKIIESLPVNDSWGDPGIYDPYIKKYLDLDVAVAGAELIVFTVAHREFDSISPDYLYLLMGGTHVYDCCGAISRSKFEKAGFYVYGFPRE